MLGTFHLLAFTPWCQVSAFLTHPKKDSSQGRVIMEYILATPTSYQYEWVEPQGHLPRGPSQNAFTLSTKHDLLDQRDGTRLLYVLI